MEYRTVKYVVYMMYVHLAFVTKTFLLLKHWRDDLSDLAIRDLQRIFAKVCTVYEAALIECDGEDDHVRLLVELMEFPVRDLNCRQ